MPKDKTNPRQMTVQEAGRRGGEATSQNHGREFYEQIGHKGGKKGGQRVRELVKEGKDSETGKK